MLGRKLWTNRHQAHHRRAFFLTSEWGILGQGTLGPYHLIRPLASAFGLRRGVRERRRGGPRDPPRDTL